MYSSFREQAPYCIGRGSLLFTFRSTNVVSNSKVHIYNFFLKNTNLTHKTTLDSGYSSLLNRAAGKPLRGRLGVTGQSFDWDRHRRPNMIARVTSSRFDYRVRDGPWPCTECAAHAKRSRVVGGRFRITYALTREPAGPLLQRP
jgi:hypothetical protein